MIVKNDDVFIVYAHEYNGQPVNKTTHSIHTHNQYIHKLKI